MKISKKGLAVQKKLKTVKYLSLAILFLAAVSFVFFRNLYGTVVLMLLDLVMEMIFSRCPHCHKMLDCRKKLTEESCCPKCQKYILRGLDE